MVGLPMGADQQLNMAKSVADDVAVKLNWHNYTADSLVDAINKVINDPSLVLECTVQKCLMR